MRVDLRLALDRAFEHGQPSLSLPIAVRFNGEAQRIYLQVRPVIPEQAARAALVLFIEGGPTDTVMEGRLPAEEPGGPEETSQHLREQLQTRAGSIEDQPRRRRSRQ